MGDRGPEPKITPDELLSSFQNRPDPCEPRTASDVAEEFDVARRTALKLLQQTAEETPIETKKIGARARVWWLPYNCVGNIETEQQ